MTAKQEVEHKLTVKYNSFLFFYRYCTSAILIHSHTLAVDVHI